MEIGLSSSFKFKYYGFFIKIFEFNYILLDLDEVLYIVTSLILFYSRFAMDGKIKA